MIKRLGKVASTLNVGIETIADYLNDKGFEIASKPSSKIDDDMYNMLLKEFYKDAELKEKADEISLGRTKKEDINLNTIKKQPQTKPEPQEEVIIKTNVVTSAPPIQPATPKPPPPAPPPPPPPIEKKPAIATKPEPVPVAEVKETAIEQPVAATPNVEEPPKNVIKAKAPINEKPKVVGKVNLEAFEKKKTPKPPKKKKETIPPATAKAKEKPVKEKVTPPPPVKAKVEQKKVTQTTKNKPAKEERKDFRETKKIQLSGPKVLGKIVLPAKDKDKQGKGKDKKRRRKRIVKPSAKTGAGSNNNNQNKNRSGNNRPFRKDNNRNNNNNSNNRGKSRRDRRRQANDIPKVSEKEIQEKIRATMAKMGGGKSKNARSKLRKQKRETIAENEMVREELERMDAKLQVSEFISVSELASLLEVSVTEVISKCMGLGVIVSINQRLDAEVIELVSNEFGHEIEFIDVKDQEEEEEEIIDAPEDLKPRPPIVTIMGHVDHGKTSLLDYIREANVIAGEVGGITQHIGAYEVTLQDGNKITFLDTPGHEAFTAMRARGAKVTDLAIIVVAADDAVMPQTKEAISHAQAAGVPMIFAINKIDKDTANPDKIKDQLSQMNILLEDWGGQFQSQELSAKTGLNVDKLLEKVLLEAELLELKANPNRDAMGTIIEASLDKGKGYVANILVQSGTLKVGDFVVSGGNYGRVKAMFDERNQKTNVAGPSRPVLLLGLDGAPQAGERFKVYESEQEAKAVANKRTQIIREQGLRTRKHITLDEIGRRLALGNFKELNLIIKGDVDGSIEATSDALQKLSTEEIQVNVIHKSVGQISETDVMLASASDAIVVGFQVRPSGNARRLAEDEGVEIRLYSIIYKAVEEIKAAMEGMLEPTIEERIVCNLTVQEVFKISRVGTIAGCFVKEGKIKRSTKVRLVRDGIVVYTGELSSLKRYKDDVKEVQSGMECGVSIKNFNDIKADDVIEGYEEVEIKRTLK